MVSVRGILAAAAAFALILVTPAHAAIFQVTYAGVIWSYEDHNGIFAPVGADLTGSKFRAVYTIDDSKGILNADPVRTDLAADPTNPTTLPVTAAFTLNHHTIPVIGYSWPSGSDSIEFMHNPSGPYYWIDSRVSQFGSGLNDAAVSTFPFLTSSDIHSALHYAGPFQGEPGGEFTLEVTLPDSSTSWTDIVLRNKSVTVGPVASAVPEPAVWVVTMLGLTATGALLRRRRTLALT
jgi:hypothetical protein